MPSDPRPRPLTHEQRAELRRRAFLPETTPISVTRSAIRDLFGALDAAEAESAVRAQRLAELEMDLSRAIGRAEQLTAKLDAAEAARLRAALDVAVGGMLLQAALAPPAAPPEVWGYTRDPDHDYQGRCPSRAAAIEEGTREFSGDPFWICRGEACASSEFVPDVDDILEGMGQRAADDVGDVAEDFATEVSTEAREELESFLRGWANRHVECSFRRVGSEERIEPKQTPEPGKEPT